MLHTNAQASNFCVIPSSGGATPSQVNSLGSIQDYLLTWGRTSFAFLVLWAYINITHLHTSSILPK